MNALLSWIPTFGMEQPVYLWTLLIALPVLLGVYATKRQLSRTRMALATALRLALLTALALALGGLTWYRDADALAVVFVIDDSASMGNAGQAKAHEFVRKALQEQGKEDVAGVVVFGGEAYVEAEAQAELEFFQPESKPSPHQTDLASGIRLASALLPADRTGRIILLSDGEETRGDASAQVLLTAGEDVEIAVHPIARETGPDVLLEDLLAPARVDEGAAYEVRVVARSEVPTTGKLRLYRNDEYLGEMPVEFRGGRADVFSFRQEATSAGLYRYRATIEVDDETADNIDQNNEVVSTVQVTGRPRILYAEGYPEQAKYLRKVMEEQGFVVDVVRPEEMPAGPAGLRPYSAVIMSDVPSFVLTRRQQEALQAYVRDMGRGLIMLGGDRSFGLGGYYKTPVEAALPVNMDIQDKTRFPKLGMVLAIDKSCSMGSGGGSPLGMAKEASIQTAELLSERDMIGVIGFDSAAAWIIPLMELTNRDEVTRKIASIRPGGGTDIYPAINRGIKGLEATDASLKHIIVLSDGMTAGADYETLLKSAQAKDITVTTVAIGSSADRATMQDFATWGGGNYYLVTDANSIPAIFTRELMLATKSFLVEEDFTPQIVRHSEVLTGISQDDMPLLHGYVGTEAKKRAVVPIVAPAGPDQKQLPILAHWRYGLGRSAAFTSDAKARWGRNWVGSAEYTQFWSQVIRWTAGNTDDQNLEVAAEIREGELIVTVDAFDAQGGFRNFLDGQARVVAPDLTVRPLELRQVSPGRYQAAVPVDQDGSWLVGVSLNQGDEVVGQSVAEAVQPYSPEYRSHGAGRSVMEELGRLGGGGVIANPEEAFTRPAVARQVPHPLWPALLVLAGFLLLADIGARRLDWPFGGEQKGTTEVAKAPAPERRAKKPKLRAAPAADLAVEEEGKVDVEKEPDEIVNKPEAADGSYVGGLLAARKKARKRRGEEESDDEG